MSVHENINQLRKGLGKRLIGQSYLNDRLTMALICNGNLLLEGYPGTAKTRAVKTLGQLLNASLGRIQFTPDLLPSDITGTEIYHHEGEHEQLIFEPGPVFNNLVLADEINRAPAKVQSALLEAMEERQVTVAGKTYALPELFMVLATQNPIDQEGTYPLPEAQMDRFLMKLRIEYPGDEDEMAIIRLVRKEERPAETAPIQISQDNILEARLALQDVFVSESIEQYIVALVMATRLPQRVSSELKEWISIGASPRASIALDKCSRCHAWLRGSQQVEPEDVRAVIADVLRHRIMPAYEALAGGVNRDQIVNYIADRVAVP